MTSGGAVNFDYLFKYIIIGDAAVGKSNLLLRYAHGQFKAEYQLTIGVEFGAKNVEIRNKIYRVQIWDTAGQERYKSITNAYYKGSKGALVVYDISRKTTFENVDKWIGELKNNASEDVHIMLVGNKSDLEDKREVKTEEVAKKADQYKIAFCETSALKGNNIENAFERLVDEITKIVGKSKNNEIKTEEKYKTINLNTEEVKEKKIGKEAKNSPKCC
jgi:Ras-related protein Rab-11A